MKIEVAAEDDIGNIMNLIEFCIKDLENQGIYQWNDHYPTLNHVEESIQSRSLYILKNEDPSNTQSVFGALENSVFGVQEIEKFPSTPKIRRIFERAMGIISISEEQPAGYGEINWFDKTGKSLVISKLAVNPRCQGQGIGQKLMDFGENYAVENGYSSIRLDAYSNNPRALKFYGKRGYKKVGEQFFPKRDLPFYCYEKLIN